MSGLGIWYIRLTTLSWLSHVNSHYNRMGINQLVLIINIAVVG